MSSVSSTTDYHARPAATETKPATQTTELIAFVVAVVAVLIAAALLSASPSAHADTRIVNVTPLASDDNLKPGLTISNSLDSGTCSGSGAFPGTYRCMPSGGGGPSEPCWVKASGPEGAAVDFVCMFEPWARQVTVFSRLDSVPTTRTGKRTPWGLKLASGARCRLGLGASSEVGGKRVNYFCGDVSLIGNPDRSRPTWRIGAVRYDADDGEYVRVGKKRVSKAWFAKAQ